MAWGLAAAAVGSYLASETGDKGAPARAEDITPHQFRRLRNPVSDELNRLISSGGGARFQGQTTADLTDQEQQFLQMIGQQGQPSQANQASQDLLNQTISGQFLSPDANPFLQETIRAAQRPVVQQFEDITMPRLRSQFTQAGQRIQEGGSSPFDRAAALATRGATQELGDISTRIAGQNYQNERGRQMQAAQLAPQIDQAQIEQLISSMEASALPRLIEQRGIDTGLEEFRRRQNALLSAIQSAGALSSPEVVTFEGTQPSSNPFADFASSYANAYAGSYGRTSGANAAG